MSATLLGAILAACGRSSSIVVASAASSCLGSAARPKTGGTLAVAGVRPPAAVNPLTVSDAGGLLMLNQTGEFLVFD